VSALTAVALARWVAAEPDAFLAEAARRRLGWFVRRLFPDYRPGAHLDLLIAAIERAVATPGGRLIVTMPPRHSKSLHVSEHLPAWYLGAYPDRRVIGAANTASLAYTFSRRVRNKLADPRWPFPGVRVAEDKGAVQAWDLDGRRGGYLAVGVGGTPTGQGADLLVIDDPIRSAADADSQTVRDALWEWYQGTIRTRLEPAASIVVTATRWHEDDLTGRLLAAQAAGGEAWEHLHLPAIADDGAPLWPERWSLQELEQTRAAVGSRTWEAQYQGRPSPPAGGTFKRDWWRYYREIPADLAEQAQSWDMTFRETKAGSYVVGQVWGRRGADAFLLDQVRFRGDFPTTIQAFRALSAKWPKAVRKLVENKANGPAVVATLRGEIAGIVEVEPEGGKLARANAVAPAVEAGNVHLPDPSIAPWVGDFVEEAAAFPFGAADDQVDGMSQALLPWLIRSEPIRPLGAPLATALRDWMEG
jgi:predicted phage terminase large subunit-like protein